MGALEELSPFTGKVSAEWVERGVWLSQAWQNFPSDALSRAALAAEKFATAEGCDHPSQYMAYADLSAEQYLEHGGQSLAAARSFCAWRRRAQLNIQHQLSSNGRLLAFGFRTLDDEYFTWISSKRWNFLTVDPGGKNVVRGEGDTFYYVKVVDPSQWPIDGDGPSDVDAKPESSDSPLWDHSEARVFLSAEKVAKRHPNRPNEKTLFDLLALKFQSVPRDPMREVARIVWPGARPGVKKGTKRRVNPRNKSEIL